MTDHIPDGRDAELLACPLCNSASEASTAFDGSIYEGHVVICANGKCGCQSGTFPTPAMARRAWNTRSAALPKEADPSREELAKAIYETGAEPGNDACTWAYARRIAETYKGTRHNSHAKAYQTDINHALAQADSVRARLAAKPVNDGVRELRQRIHNMRVTLSSVVTLANGGGVTLRNLNAIGKAAKHSLDHDAAAVPPSPGDRT